MQPADPEEKVRARHMRCATHIMSKGYQIVYGPQYREDVERLVRENIKGLEPDWQMGEDSAAAVALSPDGEVVGCLVFGIGLMDQGSWVWVQLRHLVVDKAHRGEGLGVVLLGAYPQMLALEKDLAGKTAWQLGQCSPLRQSFYAKSGYTVLDAGENIPFPSTATGLAMLDNQNPNYPCWFYRTVVAR